MGRGTFKPDKPAQNTEKRGVFNKAVNELRPTNMDDSANADAAAIKKGQQSWESEAGKTDNPNWVAE
jgi:hypothetical protein